ncbi:MAG: PspC domain-containing protein [Balneolaceae bacterium]
MAEKTQQYTTGNANFDFEDHELRETMREYLQEENKNSSNIWNFSTIAGLVMVFIAMSFMAQFVLSNTLGITTLGSDFSYILNILPVIGGVLLVLVGFGLVSSERRKKKKNIQMGKSETGSRSSSSSSGSEDSSRSAPHTSAESSHTRNRDRLDDYLYSDYSKQKKKYSSERVDSYAMQQNKKLFRSRTDKKWAGVCGGLAKYFGISPTAVRLVFVLATLLGYGSFILVYIAMGIVVPKEPVDRMELSDF